MTMIKIKHLSDPGRCNCTRQSWVNLDHVESIQRRREFTVIRTCCGEYFVNETTWRTVRNIMLCKDIIKEGDAK